jgi:hypothetical protein
MPPRDAGPPPPPGGGPPLPKPAPGRDGLLADIRGGARLKKVSDSEKRDRSQAAVPGAETPAGAAGSGPATPGGEAGLAGALASALAARKAKVSHSGMYMQLFRQVGDVLTFTQMMSRIRMIGR